MCLSHHFRNSQILPLKCILQQHLSSSREKLILRSYLNSGLNLNNKCWKGWGGSIGTIFFHGQNYIKSIKKHNLLYVNHVHLPAPSFVLWKHVSLGWSKLSVFLETDNCCVVLFSFQLKLSTYVIKLIKKWALKPGLRRGGMNTTCQ